MSTLDEALEFYARKIDEAYAETAERNFARMVENNLTAEAIEDFQKFEAETYRATRAATLAKLREWLMRDGASLQ